LLRAAPRRGRPRAAANRPPAPALATPPPAGVEHSLLPAMLPWLQKHDLPPMWVSLHVWLWQARPASDAAVLAVFREYARSGRVYDASLKLVSLEELTDDYFATKAQPAYLLSPRAYHFPALDTDLWWRENGGAPLPDLKDVEAQLELAARAGKAAARGGLRAQAQAGAAGEEEEGEEEDGEDDDAEAEEEEEEEPAAAAQPQQASEEEDEAASEEDAAAAAPGDAADDGAGEEEDDGEGETEAASAEK
jgi:hypothetical protein